MSKRNVTVALGMGLSAMAGAIITHAGPLDPPAGPVTSTYKTLAEVEPRTAISAATTPGDADSRFKITQPGSYYLTGNITGVAGKHGIEIAASGVTLDLNGFDLVGVPGMGAFDGVSVTVDGLRNITVLNGAVRNWGDCGVDLGALSRGCRVEGVLASGNTGTGLSTSISSTVTNCTSVFNGLRGIRASNGSTISNCSVESNAGSGIEVNHGCTISGCTSYFNSLRGILVGTNCTVVDCSAYQNTGHGLELGESGSATRCTTSNNGGRGISVGDACTVTDCAANSNATDGIHGASGAAISGCTTRSNTLFGIVGGNNVVIRGCSSTSNGRSGFHVSQGVVSDCVASTNSENGIVVLSGSTVTDCATFTNSGSGIVCFAGNLVRGNICDLDGRGSGDGAGITVATDDNRIEGNNCSRADRGIHVQFEGNTIIQNICSTNTIDWVIVANNSFGPILDRRNPGSAAVNGFSAPTNLNTLDPHANFSN